MAAVRYLSTNDAVFKSVINNTLKNFPQVECLREEQKNCIKIQSIKDLFAVLPTGFGKSLLLKLFPRVMFLMNGRAGGVSTIMVACLALEAIMKDQAEQVNKITVAATAIGIDEKAGKNQKVQDCV